MCRVLGVSRAGFYAWERQAPCDRELTDAWLTEKIRAIHKKSRGTYGSRRIHAELRLEHGIRVGKKRVERLMALAGLSGCLPRPRKRTTIRVEGVRSAPDLVERDFNPEAPDRLWSADITYIWTLEGWLFLAHAEDLFSRKIVGWEMQDHMRKELVIAALEMAVGQRKPEAGCIHHSDKGGQLGFKGSSQHHHLDERSCDGSSMSEVRSSWSAADVLAGSSVGGGSRAAAAVLGGDRSWCVLCGCGGRGGCVGGGWRPVVSRGWRDAYCHSGPAVGALPVLR